jgi:ribosomal protein S18 acetylase RimI-like enzyme
MIAGLAARDSTSRGLRPFNPILDLRPTTELIELAFGEALDPVSREMLREMSALAWLYGPLFWLLNASRSPLADSYGGYVWMEQGNIVGNITVHRRHGEKQGWFISNLAVHPDYRGKGIARDLMTAGLDLVRQKRARRISLEVRSGNVAARRLYDSLGFTQVDSVTRMRMDPLRPSRPVLVDDYRIELVKRAHWSELLLLAETTLSPEAREIMPLEEDQYRPSPLRRMVSYVGDLLNGRTTYRLAAVSGEEFAGVATIRTGGLLRPHSLTLMVHPAHRHKAEEMLLTSALSALETYRYRAVVAKIQPSYDFARDTLLRYGFVEEHTLDLLTLILEDKQEEHE